MKMKSRKPDVMTILALVIGLGVLATGFAQDYIRDHQATPVTQAQSK